MNAHLVPSQNSFHYGNPIRGRERNEEVSKREKRDKEVYPGIDPLLLVEMFLVVTNRSFRSLKAWNENKGNWRALSVGSRRTLNERCW